MKQIVCELCGSNDLIKKNGVYVCQHCGTQYDTEEVKKLLIEVDTTPQLNNLYAQARRAKSTSNYEAAQNYYGQIAALDANSWEAYFYSVFYQQINCKVGEISSAAEIIRNSIAPTFELINKYVAEEEKEAVYTDISSSLLSALLLMIKAVDNYRKKFEDTMEMIEQVKLAYVQGDCIEYYYLFGKTLEEYNCTDLAIKHYERVYAERVYKEHTALFDAINKRLKELDPTFYDENIAFHPQPNNTNTEINQNVKTGGCYVATAVYGSYDCPEVWTLRRFRDYSLAETWYGRAFVHTYYAISPTLVKWFGDTAWFKSLWRGTLDRMVNNLNSKGYEATPYQDREW